ncbi:DnaJ domain-containing protein [Ustulina deusta]|nr:DnaJ domain-containing protein [Ustulina deusta]
MSDHYAVLGIQQTATHGEITTAFRRLALMHHPDKNPGDISGATNRFQEIQLAYEILSDDSERRRYDASRNTTSPTEDVHDGGERTYYSFNHPGFGSLYFDIRNAFHRFEIFWQFYATEQGRGWQEARRRQEKAEARQKEREQERAWMKRRRERMARQQELRQEAKQAEKASTEALRKVLFDQETQGQQARWERAGAVTEEEKFSTCLHSEFCAKIQQRKKVKCDVCGAKRGLTAFECPHCAHHLCQLCVTTFTKKRAGAS